jgi:colanic acid/amylovoran biosynthesis glycosyltransferase
LAARSAIARNSGVLMRVAVVLWQFPVLSQTFVLAQLASLVDNGCDVTVFYDRKGQTAQIKLDQEPLSSLVRNARRWWPLPFDLRSQVSRMPGTLGDRLSTLGDIAFGGRLQGFDVVVAHFGGTGLRLARLKKRNPRIAPIVTIFHGYDVGRPFHEGTLHRYRPLFEFGSLHLTVNRLFRQMLIDVGAPPQRADILRMGVDCDDIAFRPRARGTDPLQLVTACRLVEKKGVEHALRALAQVRLERPGLAFRYTLIGDGPLLMQMKRLCAELGLNEHVSFLGALPHAEVKRLLASSDAFILPSVTGIDGDMEGVPVVLMEAMAAGLLCLSSMHSGIPELIANGKSGLLSPERDVAGLAANIIWMADNPEGALPMTRAARETVEREFNNRILHRRFYDLLCGLARGHRSDAGAD